MQVFSWTAYAHKVNHTHDIHSLNMKVHFHSYLQGIPADGYQHVSTPVSCKCIHLHQSGSLFQFWLQLKVFQDNEAASDLSFMPRAGLPSGSTSNFWPWQKYILHLSGAYTLNAPGHYSDRAARNPGTSPWATETEAFSGFALDCRVNNIYGDFWQTFL